LTVTAPPRPPGPDDLRDRSLVEALREQALIEEARRRARRRRQRYAAVALLGVFVAAGIGFGRAGGGRSAGTPAASTGLSAQGAATATNGKIAFADGGGALWVVNPDGSGLHVMARCSATIPECGIAEPAWSPDGNRLAFVRGHLGGANTASTLSLYIADAPGRHVRLLAACGSCAEQWGGNLSWSPDGSRIAFSRDSGHRGEQSLWISDTAGRKLHRLTDCLPNWCADVDPAWAPSGRRIVFSRIVSAGSSLYTIRPDGSQLRKITTVAGASDPRWSPDERKIAFDGSDRIYIADANGSHLKLLFGGAVGSGPGVPSWSPDGTKLAFFNTPGRPSAFSAEVWTINTDGSAKQRIYHSACCVGIWAAPIWSPDGKKIALAANSAGGTFVISSDGSGVRRLSAAFAIGLTWQPLP
jgi:Tol biopolymer transport system component